MRFSAKLANEMADAAFDTKVASIYLSLYQAALEGQRFLDFHHLEIGDAEAIAEILAEDGFEVEIQPLADCSECVDLLVQWFFISSPGAKVETKPEPDTSN